MAEHSSQPGMFPRYSRLLRFLLPLVAILMLLAGCRYDCPCSPTLTEHASVPNTRPITGLDRALLDAAHGSSRGVILGLAPYNTSDGTEHLLAVLDGNLYSIPTANAQAALIQRAICPGSGIALSADASQLACLGSPDADENGQSSVYGCGYPCFSEQLQIMSLTPTQQPHTNVEQTISDVRNFLSSPTWRPDGKVLAVLDVVNPPVDDVSSADSASCAIAMYAQVPAHTPILVSALSLTIAGFSLCGAMQVAWSPDGQTLAVLDSHTLLLLAAPSPATSAAAPHDGQFLKSVLTPRLRIPLQQSARQMAWSPDGHSVAVVNQDNGANQFQITRYPLDSSKPPTPLFGPDSYRGPIGPIAYSTDGRTLIFAAGVREVHMFLPRRPLATGSSANHPGSFSAQAFRPQTCGCPLPPAGLYAYTLPTL